MTIQELAANGVPPSEENAPPVQATRLLKSFENLAIVKMEK
jgi:hypothetical protein